MTTTWQLKTDGTEPCWISPEGALVAQDMKQRWWLLVPREHGWPAEQRGPFQTPEAAKEALEQKEQSDA